jgi:hypothetical protein
MRDTTPITTEITRLISTGTTEQALLAAVAHLFPDLTTAELSAALQVATAAAERQAAGTGRRIDRKAEKLMASQQTQADRLERSLRRLGLRLSRTGRTFRIINARGRPAIGSQAAMSMGDVEIWIANFIKPSKH